MRTLIITALVGIANAALLLGICVGYCWQPPPWWMWGPGP